MTQSTIGKTICVSGWTSTVRPPTSYTNPLKIRQITEYGYIDRDPTHYEEDHFIPLSLGGAPRDPRNLWPEPGTSPNPKDKVENRLHRAICDHRVNLRDAQEAIATDWTTALQKLGIARP